MEGGATFVRKRGSGTYGYEFVTGTVAIPAAMWRGSDRKVPFFHVLGAAHFAIYHFTGVLIQLFKGSMTVIFD